MAASERNHIWDGVSPSVSAEGVFRRSATHWRRFEDDYDYDALRCLQLATITAAMITVESQI